ncbi:MAG: hypothetical protein J6M39_06605 [Lachnospiraceae bacterium]|nr:hypothetical protein [Lachnospiraceae bacterium]
MLPYLMITKTMIDYNKINQLLQEGFLANKGKGSILAYPPLNIGKVLLGTIGKLILKRPNEKLLIVVEDYKYREEILKVIKETLELNEAVFIENHIQFLTQNYAYNKLYLYTTNIIVGIDNDIYINKSFQESKFTLAVITNPKIKLNKLTNIQSILPNIHLGIGDNELQQSKINVPVTEYRHGIYLSEEEKKQYDKYSDFIKDSMTVFGDFNMVELCRNGDKISNTSAMTICNNVARQNGWNSELDMSVEFNVQIDKVYNPNAIHERAQLIYNIARERKNLVCNLTSKINEVINIVKANPFKGIVIVSKSGEFANEIADALNKENIICGLYHNEIPASYMPDENGETITYKSGVNKGKPKLFKASALSTYWMQMYIYGQTHVLSMKSASDNNLEIDIDIVIFTTTLIDDIFKFKARFKNCRFKGDNTEIHRIYCVDTIEENSMYKERPTNLITICDCNIDKDISINSDTGEIIL